MSIPKPVILDISEWQTPNTINYDKLASAVDGVIVRIQYGSRYIDKHYKTHIAEFQKRGVPVAVYAWVRGVSNSDMEKEATDFYNRAKAYNPTFWWLDVEEKSMSDMRTGIEEYRAKLKSLGAKKVGAYIANHLYASFNLDASKFDGIWIPTYGSNNGQYNGS
ncbi:glycoside hydrolase family 25 protein, partial [Enterococcus gallinarum]